jgi:isoquinoline 1-oxidoreductase subunit beta
MNDSTPRLDRRSFLVGGTLIGGTLAAGVVIGIYVGRNRLGVGNGAAAGATFQPNAFVRIAPDDSVTIVIGKSEMGQGIYTGLPMVLAEELDYDPARVRVEFAPVDPAFNVPFAPVQFTGGSMSTSTTYQQLREAGARARALRVAAAADHWNVDAASLRTEDGKVFNGSESLSYGRLADAASKLPVPADVKLKDPATFRWLGKPMKRLDAPLKVDGSAKFGLDMRVPGMLFAVVARPPIVGAKLKSVDDAAARAVAGVVDVKTVPSGVAVYATNTWAAKKGREALRLDWDGGTNSTFSTEQQRRDYQALLRKPGNLAGKARGDVDAALAKAAKRIDVEYELPYLAHSPMEPLNCLADVRPDGVALYTGTQRP